jgi:hypothetical protein
VCLVEGEVQQALETLLEQLLELEAQEALVGLVVLLFV